jgi:hypothetical protein
MKCQSWLTFGALLAPLAIDDVRGMPLRVAVDRRGIDDS